MFNLTISDAAGDSVPLQLDESLAFFRANIAAISRLGNVAADCKLTLDLSWNFPRGTIGQYNTLTAELMGVMSSLGIDLMFSVYDIASRPESPNGD